jgi:hypothetical protein
LYVWNIWEATLVCMEFMRGNPCMCGMYRRQPLYVWNV